MLDAAGDALAVMLTWQGLFTLVLATVVGTMVAILPGLGAPTAMALLLPLSLTMSTEQALMYMACLIGASGFAGSMTAILIAVPGDETNAPNVLDGYPMAQRGEAGVAIGAAATASALGALFGVAVLVAAIPIIREVILLFSPPEVFILAILGLMIIGVVSSESRSKGILSGLIGMALALIGYSPIFATTRFNFGTLFLYDGIPLIPVLIGLFSLPEMVQLLGKNRSVSQKEALVSGGVVRGVREVLHRPGLLMRSSVLGTAMGIVPGLSSSIACWVAYVFAKKTSKTPESFGKGNIEGIIGPNAAIDAKDGAGLMPLLTLGIPNGLATAVLASAFLIHGINPGPAMFSQHLNIVFILVFALVFANVTTSVFGLFASNLMVKMTLVPARVIFPVVIVISFVGAYVSSQSLNGMVFALIFGVVGYIAITCDYSRAGLLTGVILTPIVEDNFHISRQMYSGSVGFLLRPVVVSLVLLVALVLVYPSVANSFRKRWSSRSSRKVQPAMAYGSGQARSGLEDRARVPEPAEPQDRGTTSLRVKSETVYAPSLDAVFLICSAGLVLGIIFQLHGLTTAQKLFPIVVLVPLSALILWQVLCVLRRPRSARPITLGMSEASRRLVTVGIIVIAFPVTVWLIGALPGVAVYCFLFGLRFAPSVRGRVSRLIEALVLSATMTVLVHLIFVRALGFVVGPGVLL